MVSKKKAAKVMAALMGPFYIVVAASKNSDAFVLLFSDKKAAIKWARQWCTDYDYQREQDDVMVFAVELDDRENCGEKVWDAWNEFK